MPLIAALSPKQVGMQSRSPGTMGRWPGYTTGTCAKFNERRPSRILCNIGGPKLSVWIWTEAATVVAVGAAIAGRCSAMIALISFALNLETSFAFESGTTVAPYAQVPTSGPARSQLAASQ